MSFVFRVFLFFSFALLLTRTSIYSTSKLLRLLRLWSDFIWIHSFHQRIKQELKKVTRYCEVDNIRCKVVFDKCTKFVFFSIRGFYVLLHGLIHLLDPVISRFFFLNDLLLAYKFVVRTFTTFHSGDFLSEYFFFLHAATTVDAYIFFNAFSLTEKWDSRKRTVF